MALNEHHTDVPRGPDRDPVLDRVYAESAHDQPPARLDDAIRAAARREVGAGPRSLRAMLRSWRMPVSIAAILVLSASLVMLMREEGADRFDDGPAPEVARTEQYYAPPPAAAPMPKRAPEGIASAPPAPVGPTAKTDLLMEQAASKARDDKQRQVESVLGRVQPSAIPPATPAEERQPAPQPAPAQPRESGAGEADRLTTARSAGVVAQEAKPSPEDVSRRQRASDADARAFLERRESRSTEQEVARSPAAAAPPAKATPRPELGAAAPASPPPVWSGFERQPPEKWVERIEELRRAGREAEAREMLGEFRKRIPEYPLPAALTR